MAMILNHLRRVASHSEKNKMTIDNLAICFGPVLLCPAPATSPDPTLDFRKHIEVLRYLLEIWEYDNGTSESSMLKILCLGLYIHTHKHTLKYVYSCVCVSFFLLTRVFDIKPSLNCLLPWILCSVSEHLLNIPLSAFYFKSFCYL